MDELLKNCYGRLFNVGDEVRIRRDIDDLAALLEKDVNRYRRMFPNRTTPVEKSNYVISLEMQSYAGKTAKVVEVFPPKNEMPLLGALYAIKINGRSRSSTWFWKHALLEKVEEGKANRIAFDASVGTRFISYDDGTYTVEGKDNIKKLLSWSYDKDKAKNVNYAIQHMIDFLGGDK